MVKSNKLSIFLALLMLAFVPFVAATCTYYSYTDGGSDYFGVNNATTNTTVIAANESFDAYTAFTPRLNFTANVSDTLTGGNVGTVRTLLWKTPLNVSSTFGLYNGTILVSPTNYSYLHNTTTGVMTLNFTDARYNATTLRYNFTRTFIKNTEDLVTGPGSIYTGSVFSDWVTVTSTGAYGEDPTFKLKAGTLGNAVTGNNWAVTWDYTEKTCTDQGCSSGVNATIFNVLATFFMLGMLVFIGFSIKNGADTTVVVTMVVVFLVMLVALQIINGIITGICAS